MGIEINFDALYREHQVLCDSDKIPTCECSGNENCKRCYNDFLKSKFSTPKPAEPEVFKFTFKCMTCGETWKQTDTDKPVLCPRGCGCMENMGRPAEANDSAIRGKNLK